MSSIALKDGLKSLYAGLGASTTSTFSMQLSFFYALSLVRSSYLERQAKKSGGKAPALSTGMELVLGAVAGALAQVFTIPVSVIATRQQLASRHSPTGGVSSDGPPRGAATVSGKPASKEDSAAGTIKAASEVAVSKLTEENSFLGVARDILREDGITGLWRGLRPSLVLTVNPAITYGMFERVKTLVLASTSDGKMTPMRSFLIGILSKSLATVVTFPYILAKVRVQSSHEKLKALPFLIKVLQEQGLSGWYQGMQAQIGECTHRLELVLGDALLTTTLHVTSITHSQSRLDTSAPLLFPGPLQQHRQGVDEQTKCAQSGRVGSFYQRPSGQRPFAICGK